MSFDFLDDPNSREEEEEPIAPKYPQFRAEIKKQPSGAKNYFTTPREDYIYVEQNTVTTTEAMAREYLNDVLEGKKSSSNKYVRPTINIKELENKSIQEKIKMYELTKNKCILYQLFLGDFLDFFRKLWDYTGNELPANVLADVINTDMEEFSIILKKYTKSSIKEEILAIAKEYYFALYTHRGIDRGNSISISINNKKILIDVLEKCVAKEIIIDPIISYTKNLEFNRKSWEIAISLVYLPFINTIIYNGHSVSGDYTGINIFMDFIADMPDKDRIGEEMIKINDKMYSKKSFESLVETDFDNFIDNLEIDCLLDKKDTDAVVEKLNLL